MPLLTQETDLYPPDLLTRDEVGQESDRCWWAIYTRSKREKELMRKLEAMKISFYSPVIARRYRSPAGRARTAWMPLFTNYVFLYGDNEDRYQAMTTNCVSRYVDVFDGRQLTQELRQIQQLIEVGAPVTIEDKLQPGRPVRVRSGPFTGLSGIVVERRGKRRLIVAVTLAGQGASVELDDHLVEPAD